LSTPQDAMRQGFPWIPVIAIGSVLAGLFIWAWIQFGWFVDTQNVQHQARVGAAAASASASVNQNSYNYNQGFSEALDSAWQAMHSDQEALTQEPASAQADTKAAVLSDGQQVCYNYSMINQKIIAVTPSIVSWVRANCDGTDVSVNSSLRR
jgi:hypothetical protein